MRKVLATLGICLLSMLGLSPAPLFASESGGGYTVQDQVTPISGIISGSGYNSVSAGDPISETVSGSGYTLTGDIYNTEVVTSGTTGSGTTSGSGTTGGSGGTSGGGGGTGGNSGEATAGDAGHGRPLPPIVSFTGTAYPNALITLTEDGVSIESMTAGSDASFSMNVSNLIAGNYIFGLQATDANGLRSLLETFPIAAALGTTTNISGIFLPPTISLDTVNVEQGGAITVSGEAAPGSTVSVDLPSSVLGSATASPNGAWSYKIDTSGLAYGTYSIEARSTSSSGMSPFSEFLSFTVFSVPTPPSPTKQQALIGDFNGDGKVDFLDFSILTYWFGKTSFPPALDLAHDGKIDMRDFSILMYYWTS